MNFKLYNINEYLNKTINWLNIIISYNKSTEKLKNFTKNLLLKLKN